MSADISCAYDVLDRDYGPEEPAASDCAAYNPSWMGRLLTWQSRLVDRFALDVMEKAFLFGDSPQLGEELAERLEQLRELYGDAHILNTPERFYAEPDSPPRVHVKKLDDLDDGERVQITFESTYQTFDGEFCDEFGCYRANSEATVRLWRHEDEPGRPTVMCLHCWCGGYLRLEERIFAARTLYGQGFNVAVVTLPFHGERTPSEALFSGQYFPSPDLRRTNEAFGQAVADVRLMTRWLREQGHSGPIGLMGISLGGYLTSLLISVSDDYDFAVPIIAPASFADILWWHGAERQSRSRFEEAGVDLDVLRAIWAIHCPLSYELKLPKERVLIVAGAGDEVVRPAQSLALWRHWGEPELRWFVGSHLGHFRWLAGSFVGVGSVFDFMSPVVDWLGELDFGGGGEATSS